MCLDKLKKIHQLRQFKIERNVLKLLFNKSFGVRFEPGYTIEVLDKNNFADVDPNEVFYYYDGPLDEKTREFCQSVLLLGKFFTQNDIDKLSVKAGYNVDLYMGSYNCRHNWIRARIKGRIQKGYTPETPTGRDINSLGKKSINNLK